MAELLAVISKKATGKVSELASTANSNLVEDESKKNKFLTNSS